MCQVSDFRNKDDDHFRIKSYLPKSGLDSAFYTLPLICSSMIMEHGDGMDHGGMGHDHSGHDMPMPGGSCSVSPFVDLADGR